MLDDGCGTGAQLERYVAAHCDVSGIDVSPAMFGRARKRLGEAVDLRLGDTQRLPFDDGMFDLVTATLVLHELAPGTRDVVVKEMLRVLMDDGRLLVVDFHVGPLRVPKGWAMRGLSVAAELTARHLEHSRAFPAEGGVPGLAQRLGVKVERTKVVAGGNMALYLLSPENHKPDRR